MLRQSWNRARSIICIANRLVIDAMSWESHNVLVYEYVGSGLNAARTLAYRTISDLCVQIPKLGVLCLVVWVCKTAG